MSFRATLGELPPVQWDGTEVSDAPRMPSMDDRKNVLLWLPSTFVLEVAVWEIGSRLGLGIVDPSWDEFGRLIGVERITWGLAGASAALLVLCLLVGSRRRTTPQLSLVLLPGVLTLACYWVGASLTASGVSIAASSFAALVISRRGDRPPRSSGEVC